MKGEKCLHTRISKVFGLFWGHSLILINPQLSMEILANSHYYKVDQLLNCSFFFLCLSEPELLMCW